MTATEPFIGAPATVLIAGGTGSGADLLMAVLLAQGGDADGAHDRPQVIRAPVARTVAKRLHRTAAKAGRRVVAVHVVRDPVAALAAGEEAAIAAAALDWLSDELAAEAATRDLPRLFLSRDDLVTDWQAALTRLGTALGLDLAGEGAEAEALIAAEPAARRLRKRERAALPGWLAEVHAVLARWSQSGEDAAGLDTLDTIRRALEPALPALRAMAKAADAGRRRAEEAGAEADRLEDRLKREKAKARAGAAGPAPEAVPGPVETAQALADLTQHLNAAEARAEAAEAAHEAALARAQALESALSQRAAERDELAAELEARRGLDDALAAARAEIERLAARLDQSNRQLTWMSRRLSGELRDSLTDALAQKQTPAAAKAPDEAERLGAELAARESELAEALAARAALDADLDELRATQAALAADLEASRAETAAERDRAGAELRAQEDRLAALAAEAEAERKKLEDWITELYASTSWKLTEPLRAVLKRLRRG